MNLSKIFPRLLIHTFMCIMLSKFKIHSLHFEIRKKILLHNHRSCNYFFVDCMKHYCTNCFKHLHFFIELDDFIFFEKEKSFCKCGFKKKQVECVLKSIQFVKNIFFKTSI